MCKNKKHDVNLKGDLKLFKKNICNIIERYNILNYIKSPYKLIITFPNKIKMGAKGMNKQSNTLKVFSISLVFKEMQIKTRYHIFKKSHVSGFEINSNTQGGWACGETCIYNCPWD